MLVISVLTEGYALDHLSVKSMKNWLWYQKYIYIHLELFLNVAIVNLFLIFIHFM